MSIPIKSDEFYIKKCLKLAQKGAGFVSPNPMVGCVIVRDGKIISQGYHHKYGEKHAEIDALDKLGKLSGRAKGATLYVNLEPCCMHGKTPPCTDRIIKEKIGRVVIGCLDKNPLVAGKGVKILKKAGIAVESGILESECEMLNQFFFKWVRTGLPYITLKIAKTLDGFVAGTKGKRIKITCEESQKEVHKMRALYDAVLIGKNTAINDNPKLTVRKVKGRQPFRVVLDSRGELLGNRDLNLFKDKFADKTIVITGKKSLKTVLSKLAKKNIASVLVEGGPSVWASFMNEKMADKIIVFTSPKRLKEGIKIQPNFKIEKSEIKKKSNSACGCDKMETFYVNIY